MSEKHLELLSAALTPEQHKLKPTPYVGYFPDEQGGGSK